MPRFLLSCRWRLWNAAPQALLKYAQKRLVGASTAIVFVVLTSVINSLLCLITPAFSRIFLDRLQTGKPRNASTKFRKTSESKNTKAVSFRLREAQHHLRRSRNIIGRKPTSFEAMPQHRSFVPRKAAMKLPLRANDVACATQMMLCLRHK